MATRTKWNPKDFNRRFRAEMDNRVDRAALYLVGDIVKRFKKGNKTGKTPSAPGEIPAVASSRLKGSITRDKPREFVRRVGSTLKPQGNQQRSYAMMLEYRTIHMEARPWLRPGLDRSIGPIKRIIGAK